MDGRLRQQQQLQKKIKEISTGKRVEVSDNFALCVQVRLLRRSAHLVHSLYGLPTLHHATFHHATFNHGH